MSTFFKPATFGKNAESLQFKTIFKTASADSETGKNSNQKKKKKKQKQQLEGETTPKVLAGRIEKKTKIKEKKKKQVNVTKTANQEKQSEESKQPTKAKVTTKVQDGRIEKRKNKKKINKAMQKQLKDQKEILKPAVLNAKKVVSSSDIDSLADQLRERLKGGRFRFINEQLYTMDSKSAQKLFKDDPDSFGAYHDGYRYQVEKWPLNPLDRIIKMVRRLPKTLEIGDFGCGEGRLAQSVPNKVYSMDLVAARDDIIACDMAKTPLSAESLDIAVYCLSLMGTNLHEYLIEANRVLKEGGLMFIAEIQSRFNGDVRPFLNTLTAAGFELIKQEEASKIFYFFQLKKTRPVGLVAKLPPLELKPCVYKKR